MRKHYIDNLRWLTLLLLIPYHTAMAWNVWDEPNYIFFEGNKTISSIIVFFSPYFMPLLFTLAGISTGLALQKRTMKEYLAERIKKLLIPCIFGTLALMPIMTYIADRFNCSYSGSFVHHYTVFFTRFTDLTGADGGFSLGQFWFLLYLLIISFFSMALLHLLKKFFTESNKKIPFILVPILGLPLPFLREILSIGGKSLAEYTYLFLIGYFVFSDDEIIDRTAKHSPLLLTIGLLSSVLNVYLFIWSDEKYTLLNNIANFTAEWFMLTALLGLAEKHFNSGGKITQYMKTRSFPFYIYHFICVVSCQYLLHSLFGDKTAALYIGTVLLSYPLTFLCCEINARIPLFRLLTGMKTQKSVPDLCIKTY